MVQDSHRNHFQHSRGVIHNLKNPYCRPIAAQWFVFLTWLIQVVVLEPAEAAFKEMLLHVGKNPERCHAQSCNLMCFIHMSVHQFCFLAGEYSWWIVDWKMSFGANTRTHFSIIGRRRRLSMLQAALGPRRGFVPVTNRGDSAVSRLI